MSQEPQVQLNPSAVLQVPLESYDQDFTFIVNGQEFHTSRLKSELLSPRISQIHQNDPAINSFTINTHHQGDFQYILQLTTFSRFSIPEDQIQFFGEVIELLGNDSIDISDILTTSITNENVVDLLQHHERFGHLYRQIVTEEIEYLSSHFYELYERYGNEIKSLSFETIERIVSNPSLKLKNEDQLLKFINELYQDENNPRRSDYSNLYDYVVFMNVETETIGEFIDHFRIEDLSEETWRRISIRLRQAFPDNREEHNGRYAYKEFAPNGEQNFDGVFKYLTGQTNGNIADRVTITASSRQDGCYNVTQFDNDSCYQSSSIPNSWICFDFKTSKLIPTNYQIKTSSNGQSSYHPKSWIIEGSNDNVNWERIAEENNCGYTNGYYLCHVFTIANPNEHEFRYIKMTQIGPNWYGSNNYYHFTLNRFELYGKLI